MATLLSKVRNITKSTTSETSDASVVTFLQAGANYVFMSIPKSLLWYLASDGSTITDGNGQAVAPDTIISVKRNSYPCAQVSFSLSKFLTDSSSLYYATATYPKYYIESGKVYIKPDPTASATGIISRITIPTITTSTDGDTAAYADIQNPIVNYGAGLDAFALAGFFSELGGDQLESNENYSDAMAKAQNLIDNLGTTDVESYLSAEDPEMAATAIHGASQEVNRAMAAIQSIGSFNTQSKLYTEQGIVLITQAQKEVETYIKNNQRILELGSNRR